MKRGAEFKAIYDARQELIAANDAILKLIVKAKDDKQEQNSLIDLFAKTGTAQANLTKIIDAVHAKRFIW